MLYAHDTDGRIVGMVIDSPTWKATKENAGFTVIESSERHEKDDYYVDNGVMVPKTAVSITADKSEIAADGVDQAVLTVDPLVDIEINGSIVESADIGPITATCPGEFEVRAADSVHYKASPLKVVAS